MVILSECAPNVKSTLFSTPTLLLQGVLCALRVSRWAEMGPGLLVCRLTLCLLSLGQARAAGVAHESCTTPGSLSASRQRVLADQVRKLSPSSGVKQGRLGYDEPWGPSSPLPALRKGFLMRGHCLIKSSFNGKRCWLLCF